MKYPNLNPNSQLIHEEKKALRIYILLFYSVLMLYDVFYYFLYPLFITQTEVGLPTVAGYWVYLILFSLIPISFYLFKMNKLHAIKYMYVIVYLSVTALDDIISFLGRDIIYQNGNAAEIVFLLFSPIFINKKFFWTIFFSLIFKYGLIGIVLNTVNTMLPILLVVIFSIVAYILLTRFSSYIEALTDTHEELRHKEKLAFVGQMATTIGHEIRNPLASLKGFTQLQREKHKEDEAHYSIMEQEIDRIDSILNDVLVIGKPKSLHVSQCNLEELINYVISITEQSEQGKNCEIDVQIENSLPLIECDEKQMKQVFLNLIKNGVESVPDDGKLTIECRNESNNWVLIRICDKGCGIPKIVQEKLFEPFFTTKDYGTGLGLMVSKKIIEDHHGTIQIASEEGKGTEVTITLPITQ
ncbi:ATP-binding protein [Ferdinandcohnia sp. Marseille-Q9671]